jgi:hypothetical protein
MFDSRRLQACRYGLPKVKAIDYLNSAKEVLGTQENSLDVFKVGIELAKRD